MPAKNIAMWQGMGEYPSLHIMITDNPRYQDGKLCLESTEEAILKFSAWLQKNVEGCLNDK
jgi:hypothetical protein